MTLELSKVTQFCDIIIKNFETELIVIYFAGKELGIRTHVECDQALPETPKW